MIIRYENETFFFLYLFEFDFVFRIFKIIFTVIQVRQINFNVISVRTIARASRN